MRFVLMSLLFCCFFIISSVEAGQVMNPTLDDLQGTWEGTFRLSPSRSGSRYITLTFENNRMRKTTARSASNRRVEIKGSDIISVSTDSGYWCKLYKNGNAEMTLECDLQSRDMTDGTLTGTLSVTKINKKETPQ